MGRNEERNGKRLTEQVKTRIQRVFRDKEELPLIHISQRCMPDVRDRHYRNVIAD